MPKIYCTRFPVNINCVLATGPTSPQQVGNKSS